MGRHSRRHTCPQRTRCDEAALLGPTVDHPQPREAPSIQLPGRTPALNAASEEPGYAWLRTFPSAVSGTLLTDQAFEAAVSLRLATKRPAYAASRPCPRCHAPADLWGQHALACSHSSGRHHRHSEINEVFRQALCDAGVPAIREPLGLLRTDGKRPDGVTTAPMDAGRCLVWDATVLDTFCASNVNSSACRAGDAAIAAEELERTQVRKLGYDYRSRFLRGIHFF